MNDSFIVRASADGEHVKYWTGVMIESWPEYLSQRKQAAKLTEREANQRVAEFSARFDWRSSLEWTAVAI